MTPPSSSSSPTRRVPPTSSTVSGSVSVSHASKATRSTLAKRSEVALHMSRSQSKKRKSIHAGSTKSPSGTPPKRSSKKACAYSLSMPPQLLSRGSSEASTSSTGPRAAASAAHMMPAGPAPTTTVV